jgi:hypothetical protein
MQQTVDTNPEVATQQPKTSPNKKYNHPAWEYYERQCKLANREPIDKVRYDYVVSVYSKLIIEQILDFGKRMLVPYIGMLSFEGYKSNKYLKNLRRFLKIDGKCEYTTIPVTSPIYDHTFMPAWHRHTKIQRLVWAPWYWYIYEDKYRQLVEDIESGKRQYFINDEYKYLPNKMADLKRSY